MKKTSRHILLIEASLSGHHSIYLERTALAFTADGHQVTVALPITLKETLGELNVVFANSAINLFWYEPSFNLNSTGTLGLLQRE
ncbi:MAG: hypothetical protein H7240_05610, partial [Glaciimonas sp.]|nr:hypothetical protein [Glaciimonas sp.]